MKNFIRKREISALLFGENIYKRNTYNVTDNNIVTDKRIFELHKTCPSEQQK